MHARRELQELIEESAKGGDALSGCLNTAHLHPRHRVRLVLDPAYAAKAAAARRGRTRGA